MTCFVYQTSDHFLVTSDLSEESDAELMGFAMVGETHLVHHWKSICSVFSFLIPIEERK